MATSRPKTGSITSNPLGLPKSWIAGFACVSLLLGGGGATVGSLAVTPKSTLEEIRADVAKLSDHVHSPGHTMALSRIERLESDVDEISRQLAATNERAREDVRKIEKTLAAICAALPRARCPQ